MRSAGVRRSVASPPDGVGAAGGGTHGEDRFQLVVRASGLEAAGRDRKIDREITFRASSGNAANEWMMRLSAAVRDARVAHARREGSPFAASSPSAMGVAPSMTEPLATAAAHHIVLGTAAAHHIVLGMAQIQYNITAGARCLRKMYWTTRGFFRPA